MSFRVFLLMLLSQFGEVTAQLVLKKGTNNIDPQNLRGVRDYLRFFRQVLGNATIWFGLITALTAMAVWLMVLAHVNLSFAFPFESLIYVWVLIGSGVFLKEKINRAPIIGTVLIMIGIVIVSLS